LTVAGITWFEAFRNVIALVLIVLAFIASLKVTLTLAEMGTPVEPLAGTTALTVGGVVSVDGTTVVKVEV
jgi:hypothetical protein